tara:strand:- start:1 stop:417 length:417 start_codon:yes stop_codon:yes gene_type:complete
MKDYSKLLGFEKKASSRGIRTNLTLEGKITKRLGEVIRETLTSEFSEYFHEIDSTTMMKQDKDGNLQDITDDSGYRVLIPLNEKVTLRNGKNKEVLANAVRVGDPQVYLKGIKHWVCEYIKLNGKTHTFKDGKLTQTK